jgi:hypothetical protein
MGASSRQLTTQSRLQSNFHNEQQRRSPSSVPEEAGEGGIPSRIPHSSRKSGTLALRRCTSPLRSIRPLLGYAIQVRAIFFRFPEEWLEYLIYRVRSILTSPIFYGTYSVHCTMWPEYPFSDGSWNELNSIISGPLWWSEITGISTPTRCKIPQRQGRQGQ